MTTRETIWDLVYDLVPELMAKQLPLYEGVKEWEDEVKDIVESIEELAFSLENYIVAKSEYDMNDAFR